MKRWRRGMRCRFDRRVLSDEGSDTSAFRLPFPRDAVKPDLSSRTTVSFTQCAAFSRALDSFVTRAAIARREVEAT